MPYPQRTNAGMIGSPVYANGFVYAGSLDGYVDKLDAATGQRRWEASLGNWIFSTPAVSTLSDGRTFVYVTSSWSGLVALDDASGRVAWRFPLPGLGENPRIAVYASPAVIGDVIYVADGTGRVYAFDGKAFTPPPASSPPGAEGTNKPLWAMRPTTNAIRATPTISGSLLYVLDNKNGMYALRTTDGTTVWSNRWDCASVTATDTPVVSGTRVFWTANCGPYVNAFVYAANAATGVLQWQTRVENRIYDNAYYMSSLAVADNTVYVPAPSSLWALDAGTGTIRWKSPGPIQDAAHINMFFTSPGIANGLVSVGLFTSGSDSPGGYAVFDAASGAIRVSEPDEDQVYSSPTIANGIIFMGIHDLHPGVVIAYR